MPTPSRRPPPALPGPAAVTYLRAIRAWRPAPSCCPCRPRCSVMRIVRSPTRNSSPPPCNGLVLERDGRAAPPAGRAAAPRVARHADDVPLQAAEVVEEDLDRLLLALRPAFGHVLVPVGHLGLGPRQRGIGRARRRTPGPHEIRSPVGRRRGQLGNPGDLVDAGGLARDLSAFARAPAPFAPPSPRVA